ncbi:class I SAM-dependent methyltransferase [Thalassospira povalilytica]|uniref:class I SAM-dependent methyltransferase n=1 Tax=Thalassospira povalilytica TaxID=732237 RepID=UPI003AA97D91
MEAKYKNFKTYLEENQNERPKEIFVQLADLLQHKLDADKQLNVLDVGCATGALVQYLKQRFNHWSLFGEDISHDLISEAKVRVTDASFSVGSVLEEAGNSETPYNVIVCTGVLGIFDEAEARQMVTNLVNRLAPRGVLVLVANFNDFDVDVQITHRKTIDDKQGDWEKGWNIFSKSTLNEWVSDLNCEAEFKDFSLPFDLERNKKDPVRTWSVEVNSEKRLTNGLKILVDLGFMVVRKK